MKKLLFTSYIFLLLAGLTACSEEQNEEATDTAATQEENTESSDWLTLDRSAWRNYKADTLSELWVAGDTFSLHLTERGGGDIITKEKFENFELELDWLIAEGGNSGVFFRVIEADSLNAVYYSGPEMQVLDDERHPDAKIVTHRAGDNYDLQSVSEETVNPAGQWNSAKLVVNEGKVEHWLNGKKVIEYEIGSPEWQEQYNSSKFAEWSEYAKHANGHIALQDHGDKVWFKNVRIKRL